jgi:hypothetical protein
MSAQYKALAFVIEFLAVMWVLGLVYGCTMLAISYAKEKWRQFFGG